MARKIRKNITVDEGLFNKFTEISEKKGVKFSSWINSALKKFVEREGNALFVECTKEEDGFTIGKRYKVIGCAGELIKLIDDNEESATVFEGSFKPVSTKVGTNF